MHLAGKKPSQLSNPRWRKTFFHHFLPKLKFTTTQTVFYIIITICTNTNFHPFRIQRLYFTSSFKKFKKHLKLHQSTDGKQTLRAGTWKLLKNNRSNVKLLHNLAHTRNIYRFSRENDACYFFIYFAYHCVWVRSFYLAIESRMGS